MVDHRDRPLAVLPLTEVHKQLLMHRSVMVLVYHQERKLYLQRRARTKSLYPGRWDLSATGHVRSGESREDAARRELREELGLDAPRLELLHQVQAGPATGWEHVSIFSAGRLSAVPRPNPAEVETGAFHDPDEVAFLVENFAELLTPALLYAWEHNLMFAPAFD